MKHTKNILGTMLLTAMAVAATSCVDDSKLLFAVEKPASIAGREYLNEYDVLKSYVSSSANPDFKLGIALTANDYIGGGMVTRLVNSNFHEMTAGNAMKYASCVSNNGTMNFETVDKFVTAARAGGITIYGHTLAWHSQQNNAYLNGLIEPIVIPGEAGNGGYCMIMYNETAKTNVWEAQTFYELATTLTQGTEYTLKFKVKATGDFKCPIYLQGGDQAYPGEFNIGTEWADVNFTITPGHGNSNKIFFNFGTFAGKIYIDDITLTAPGSSEYLINTDFENGNLGGWRSWGNDREKISEDGEGYKEGTDENGYCLKLMNETTQPNIYGAQVWYELGTPLTQGTSYTLTCMAKATSNYTPQIYLQSTAVNTQGYPGGLPAGTNWTEVKLTFTPGFDLVDKITFNFGTFSGTIYIDNIKLTVTDSSANLISNGDFEQGNVTNWKAWNLALFNLSGENEGFSNGGAQIIEKTPEEKKEILTKAMGDWVAGMMEACDGYVTAWDVVNEAISGRDAGDGYYGLQSATRSTVSEEDARNNFYWQDYLGDLDYIRTTIKLAREYFAEYGGNPSALKLFINDYNLESDWDDNKKMKSMVKWIERWEEDGVTKIDGIGTQMHVSCYANAATQKSKEDHVVQMYQLMAATGKLIKISELDMGYVDENGNSVKTADMTEEQHKAMAEYYKFIVKKYFEIIPAAQQYGITQWCMTDSPTDSGWRAGEPVGLWDLNYSRKPAYAGFADGLAGK